MSQALPSSAGFPMRQPVDLRHLHDPPYQAYQILHVAFTVAPILAGLDKFLHLLVNWDNYLAPVINNMLGGLGHEFRLAAGLIEFVAGIGVALWPRIFSYVVAAWLLGIIINLLLIPASNSMPHYDIALRDLGLCLAALALGRLSAVVVHDAPTTSTRVP
jgi:hypothetical protein